MFHISKLFFWFGKQVRKRSGGSGRSEKKRSKIRLPCGSDINLVQKFYLLGIYHSNNFAMHLLMTNIDCKVRQMYIAYNHGYHIIMDFVYEFHVCTFVRAKAASQPLGPKHHELVPMIGHRPAVRHRCHWSHTLGHRIFGYANTQALHSQCQALDNAFILN